MIYITGDTHLDFTRSCDIQDGILNLDEEEKIYDYRKRGAYFRIRDFLWCTFEVILGANQIEKATNDLLNLKKHIEDENGKTPSALCVICGLTNAAYKRPDGVYVVPITALKP